MPFGAEHTGFVPSLRSGLIVAGRYRLVDRLGVGGMSEVWRGYDEVLGRSIAVKVLAGSLQADASLRELIRQEARAMARLSHPNVTSVFDYGEFTTQGGASVPYVVMELLRGQTLGRLLARGPLPVPEAVRITAQVAAALSAAHRLGLVHCDVTPANVMLTSSGVKVLDFGVAAVLGSTRNTDGQPRFGTAGYIAPERLTRAVPDAPAVDVYGLGALLYAALVGQPPQPARDLAGPACIDSTEMLASMRVAGVPADVADLCLRCLAHEALDRPDSAEVARVLTAALAAVAGGLASDAVIYGDTADTGTLRLPSPEIDETPPVALVSSQEERWHRPLLVAVAIVAAGLLLAGVYLLSAATPYPRSALPQVPTSTPSTATAAPAGTTAAPPSAAANQPDGIAVFALRQAVVDGRAAGEIRADCAQDLLDRIADLQRRIDRGQQDNALQRIEQIREDIGDRVADGDITEERAVMLRAELGAIVV